MQDELRVKNNILFLDFMAIEMVIYFAFQVYKLV